MGDTSRNAPLSFEEMAEDEESVITQSIDKDYPVLPPKEKVGWFQSLLNWWSK